MLGGTAAVGEARGGGDGRADGEVKWPARSVKDTRSSCVANEAQVRLIADIAMTPDREKDESPISGAIELETEGTVTKDTVLAFWPVSLGTGARSFTAKRLSNTDGDHLRAQMTPQRYRFAEG